MNGSLIKLVKDDLSIEGLVIRQNGNIVTHYNNNNEIILTKRGFKFESIKLGIFGGKLVDDSSWIT